MKLRKRIFAIIIILAALITCTPFTPEETGEPEYTDVVYSAEENTITIYLNGQVPVSRALSKELAEMGCDYFEVTFLYQTPSSATIVARGDWMAGKKAGVNGVYRDTPVDYGDVSATPGPDSGSAILFAGKTDKTLMGIGRLVRVDGDPTTVIDSATTSVTFALAAIEAAVNVDPFQSSFLTAAKNDPYDAPTPLNTLVSPENVFATEVDMLFPTFELELGKEKISATYEFKLHSGHFGDYTDGLFVSPPPITAPGLPAPTGIIERKQPRYSRIHPVTGDSMLFHESILLLDEKTVITMENNDGIKDDGAFNSVVKFSFDTRNTVSGSVFSLVFSIPVYALREADENGQTSRWFIRSSYGTSLYDLDDGTNGTGGAVLIRTGKPVIPDGVDIWIRTPPNKWSYPAAPPPEVRIFDVDGLEVFLVYKGTTKTIRKLEYNELRFIVGPKYENPTWSFAWCTATPDPDPYIFAAGFYGCIEVTVEYNYTLTNQDLQAKFYLMISNSAYNFSSFGLIQHIYTGADFDNLINNAPGGVSILVVFHNSFDITQTNLNVVAPPAPRLFFMVAAEPDIVIGRGGGTPLGNTINHQITSPPGMNGLNAYYFGTWPFNAAIPGGLTATYPYTVNAGGSYTDIENNPPYPFTNKMIRDQFSWNSGSDGGIYNVKVGPGVTIIEPNLLH